MESTKTTSTAHKRLSSKSASLSLSNLLYDTDDATIGSSPHKRLSQDSFQIHATALVARKPSGRVTMHSYFDNKENVNTLSSLSMKNDSVSKSEGTSKHENLTNDPPIFTDIIPKNGTAVKSPLSLLNSNKINRHSLSSMKTTSTTKTKSSRHSRQSYQSTDHHKKANQSVNYNDKRVSVDTFNSIPSSISEDTSQSSFKQYLTPSQNLDFDKEPPKSYCAESEVVDNIEKLSINESTESFDPKLRKSLSFRSLRASLSFRVATPATDKRKSLKASNRKLSLENIRSLLTNKRSSVDLNSEYKNNISLPILQQETKDKIRTKLRNSSSIVSINSFVSKDDSSHANKIKTIDMDQIHYSLLLKLCSQTKPISFNTYLSKFQNILPQKHLTKLKRSLKNNYLLYEFQNARNPSGVWKIIPFDFNGVQQGTHISNVIQELTLTMLMNGKEGFININSAKIVSGKVPSTIMEIMGNDPNLNFFSDNQLYLIMRLEYGGIALSQYNINNWKDAATIFEKILKSVSLGEDEYYEHRNLNSSNILVKEKLDENGNKDIDIKIIDHSLSRGVVSGQIMYRNLLDAEFFKNTNSEFEYKHVIYKLMRRAMAQSTIPNSSSSMSLNTISSTTTLDQSIDWSICNSKTNLLWIHYLLKQIIFEKNLKPIKMNPILKKKNWLLSNGGDVGVETTKYEKLIQAYRMVDPDSIIGQKKNKYMTRIDTVKQLREWWS